VWEILLLKNLGNKIRKPYSKHIDDGIFELRIKALSNIARVFSFFFDKEKIILTNGFVKKSQKTPKKEIEKARKYKTDYI
jgi:phage-related protein